MNWVIKNKPELTAKNYVLKNGVGWIGLSKRKIDSYKSSLNSEFRLILFGDKLNENDYYDIPFSFLQDLLVPSNLSASENSGRSRWLAWVKDHHLKIGRGKWHDISKFYGIHRTIMDNTNLSVNVQQEDYSSRNEKRLVLVRLDQERFRSAVLGNFNTTCCLTGTKESNLLDACHIKPRSHDATIGGHHENGLCLTAGYHRLFDRGYFSFDENLDVVITESFDSLGVETKKQLNAIRKKDLRRFRDRLNLEAIEYHYKHIFEKKINSNPEPDELLSMLMDTKTFI